MYELKQCVECGSAIPVNPESAIAICGFCGAEYDIINHGADHQRADHQFSFTDGLLVGGLTGLFLGAIIFTATGRSMAVSAIKKGGNLAGSTVDNWLKTGEKK